MGDPENQKKTEIVKNWGILKHNRLFEHIIALGSRVDMLVTGNSILIAGLLILLFGSSESKSIRSQIGFRIPFATFIFLGFSLIFCIVSIFSRVEPEKKYKFLNHFFPIKSEGNNEKDDYFTNEPKDITDFVNQIEQYCIRAKKSIDRRHRLMNWSALLIILALICIGCIIYKIIDP